MKQEQYTSNPKTKLEAVNNLQIFLEEDMWYAQRSEWKTEADMLKYLRSHFKICKEEIKDIELSK